MVMPVVVRRPVLDDVNDLARINIDTWRATYTGIVPQEHIDQMDLAAYRRRWVDRLTSPSPRIGIFVAEVDDTLAAYATAGPYRPQESAPAEAVKALGELYAIYVDPPMQGNGAGTAVHAALLKWLAGEGYNDVALWVLVANEAGRRWYARRGWQPDGAMSVWEAAGQELPELRLRRRLTPLTGTSR
jgi:GNAT superfamily N-acetyltransferase